MKDPYRSKRVLASIAAAGVAAGLGGALAESAAATSIFCDQAYLTNGSCRYETIYHSPIYGDTHYVNAGPGSDSNNDTASYCTNAYKYIGGQKKGQYDACGYQGSSAQSTFNYTPSDQSDPAVFVYYNVSGHHWKGSYDNY